MLEVGPVEVLNEADEVREPADDLEIGLELVRLSTKCVPVSSEVRNVNRCAKFNAIMRPRLRSLRKCSHPT
jgi:hypothetical protein